MENTFIKNIQGHQLEFKQIYPAAYNVSLNNLESKQMLSLKKDERGMWNVNKTENLPAWFNEISIHVHHAMEENETKERTTPPGFPQLEYLF